MSMQGRRRGFDPRVGKILWRRAAHSSLLAWRTPWTEEPGGPHPQGHKESDTTEATEHTRKVGGEGRRKSKTTSVFLA